MAEVSEAIGIDEIATSLPRRLHAVMDRFVKETPDQLALVEDGDAWTYRELDRHVREVARELASFGVRAGDRIMIVSENCIALAAWLLAALPATSTGKLLKHQLAQSLCAPKKMTAVN